MLGEKEGDGEGQEVFSLGSVGHIFQFLQHNQIYSQQVKSEKSVYMGGLH